MRCLLKFNTTPASSHLSGTDSYLITISLLSASPERRERTRGRARRARGGRRGGRDGSERVELLVWSGTTEDRCRTYAATVAGVIVIATCLFLGLGRVSNSRGFPQILSAN